MKIRVRVVFVHSEHASRRLIPIYLAGAARLPITLAAPMSGDYIVQLTYWPADPSAATDVFLVNEVDDQHIVVGTFDQPQNNDQIMYSVFLKT